MPQTGESTVADRFGNIPAAGRAIHTKYAAGFNWIKLRGMDPRFLRYILTSVKVK